MLAAIQKVRLVLQANLSFGCVELDNHIVSCHCQLPTEAHKVFRHSYSVESHVPRPAQENMENMTNLVAIRSRLCVVSLHCGRRIVTLAER